MSSRLGTHGWLLAAIALTAAKLWLTNSQTIFAIGPAFHDDRLFADLAAHLINGDWLGPYNQFTLAKGPMFPLFIAAVFWIGLPLMLAQQLLYAAACATVTRAFTPWLHSGATRFALYSVLLWNPMSYDAGNLSRLMRQNLGTPLALFTIAGLIVLFHRRHESTRRQILPAVLAGLALGAFWLTREEGVWFLPAVGLLLLALPASLGRTLSSRWRSLTLTLALFIGSALMPLLAVSSLNLRHYGWFGTVEFHATEFKDAYGALTRIRVGPELPQVPVTRQMREAAYAVSPAFARLQPFLEGPVGDHWSEKELFPAAERQMRGGWFVWALRDAVQAAGLAPDAAAAMRHYRRIADEINAACEAGRVPALAPRSGFAPPLSRRLVHPLVNTAVTYTGFFLSFDGFTPYSPDSVGDYAELKPFRNVVGTRLSHAPRSLEPVSPEQQELQDTQLARLDRIGTFFSSLITWLGPLLLLVGAVRALESAADRRLSYPLGLAGALLAACAAYLAINILVQVTSFYNMSPAALASAYPVYLVALAAIAIDAWRGWRSPAVIPSPVSAAAIPPAAAAVPASHPSRWLWLAPVGTALVVLAARVAEIHWFGSDVPYNDQWYIEAGQMLAPWLNGTLQLRDFFIPHFEHVPVWTRLLVWLQVILTGRWDPLVQMTVNAVLHATFIWLVARWAYRSLRALSAHLVAVVLILGGALPHAWENIAWGFQSQFPLALIFLFLHVQGACTHAPGTKGWWLAQGAALAALLTLASMWLAPLAVVASWWWTGPRRWRNHAVPLLIAALGVGVLILIRVHLAQGGAFAQVIRSPLVFLHASFHLLGWPSLLPGAVAIVQLPWIIHALRLRNQSATAPVDRIIFVLGLVNCMQALALAFARTGDTNDFVSRYGDLFFLGVLAGVLALPRLIPAAGRMRTIFFALAVLWAGLAATGLVRSSTQGHAHYFHLHAAENAGFRRAAIQDYLASGNRELLDSSTARWTLCQEPDIVCRLLDQPSFRDLLPASVNPRSPADPVGTFVRGVQTRWSWLLAAGTVLLAIGAIFVTRRPAAGPPAPLPAPADPWRFRLAAASTLFALALMCTWSDPFSFNRERRWQRLLGGTAAIKNLTFAFVSPSPFEPGRLHGAAPILPEVLRNQFFGTAPEGPGFTGTVISSPFRISTPWLIVPYAGYPVGHGNGLRLRLLDDQGNDTAEEIGCPGPNLDGISYWVVDVRRQQGRQARVVLYDGRTDTEAWVAAAPPIAANNASLAETLAVGLKNEAHAATHVSLGVIAFVACLCAVFSWSARRRP